MLLRAERSCDPMTRENETDGTLTLLCIIDNSQTLSRSRCGDIAIPNYKSRFATSAFSL